MAARSDRALRRVCTATLDQLRSILPSPTASGWVPANPGRARQHAGQVMFLLTDALQTLTAPTARRPASLSEHLANRGRADATMKQLTTSVVGNDPADVLIPQAGRLFADLQLQLTAPDLPASVETLFGTAKLIDYLRGVLVEAIGVALREDLDCPDDALVEASRALAAVLAERHPGASIEVRVPPAVAVQVALLGQGPTHTRGTPPNVVETDTRTFVQLATGALSWDEAQAQHLVQSSGAHAAEVATLLPVV